MLVEEEFPAVTLPITTYYVPIALLYNAMLPRGVTVIKVNIVIFY